MQKVIEELSIKYGLDKGVIKTIVDHPFLFVKYRMMDDTNDDVVTIPYFCKFALKEKRTLESKQINAEKSAIKVAEREARKLRRKYNSTIEN